MKGCPSLDISAYHKCLRLGPLPPPDSGWSNILELYFQKDGAYIQSEFVQTVGKCIIIRLGQKLDTDSTVHE